MSEPEYIARISYGKRDFFRRAEMADRLISADALMKEIAKVKKHIQSENSDYLTGYVCALSGVEGQIAYQPTVDAVEVVHGRWDIERGEVHTNCVCSACRKMFYYFNRGQLQIDKMPYCPNCGAKMDLEVE